MIIKGQWLFYGVIDGFSKIGICVKFNLQCTCKLSLDIPAITQF